MNSPTLLFYNSFNAFSTVGAADFAVGAKSIEIIFRFC